MMFKTIILDLMNEKGLNSAELSKISGIPYTTIRGWINANKLPDYFTLIKLSDFFQVSTDYLLGREDDLGNVKIPDVSPVLSNDENDLLRFYRAMSDVEKRAIFDTAKAFYSNHSKGKITV